MILYHGTARENLESIMSEGLKPYVNLDSSGEEVETAVVSLVKSAREALIDAYSDDTLKIDEGLKENLALGYVALRVDASAYNVRRWQVDEWWIMDTIRPADITPVMEASREEAERMHDAVRRIY